MNIEPNINRDITDNIPDVNPIEQQLGYLWNDFADTLTTHNAKTLARMYNLICIMNPDNIMSGGIGDILSDEKNEPSVKLDLLYDLLTDGLIATCGGIGIFLDNDEVQFTDVYKICSILEFCSALSGYEDLIGLENILSNPNDSTTDRFIKAFNTYNGIEEEDDDYRLNEIIKEVTEDLLTVLVKLLVKLDATVEVPLPVSKRIKANLEAFNQCFVGDKIKAGVNLASPYLTYLELFKGELEALTKENIIEYYRSVVCILLMSSLKNQFIKDKYLEITTDVTKVEHLTHQDSVFKSFTLGESND